MQGALLKPVQSREFQFGTKQLDFYLSMRKAYTTKIDERWEQSRIKLEQNKFMGYFVKFILDMLFIFGIIFLTSKFLSVKPSLSSQSDSVLLQVLSAGCCRM